MLQIGLSEVEFCWEAQTPPGTRLGTPPPIQVPVRLPAVRSTAEGRNQRNSLIFDLQLLRCVFACLVCLSSSYHMCACISCVTFCSWPALVFFVFSLCQILFSACVMISLLACVVLSV